LTAASKRKRIPPALARVRKEIPRPGKIFESKMIITRKRAKEKLQQEWKKSIPRKS
jgi:hypothetical protein